MRKARTCRRPHPDDQLPTWAAFVPMPDPGRPDGDRGTPTPHRVHSTTAASSLDSPAAPRRLDLEQIPPQARPLLEEFAQDLAEDLLAISPVGCGWPDCRFPVTVLIKTKQAINGGLVQLLVWGCPKCGRKYQPKEMITQEFDQTEAALFGQRREFPKTPEATASLEAADALAIAQRLLDFGQRHSWPKLRLAPWADLPGSESHWRRFAGYLSTPDRAPLAETQRRRMVVLAHAALDAWEKQACSVAGSQVPAIEQA